MAVGFWHYKGSIASDNQPVEYSAVHILTMALPFPGLDGATASVVTSGDLDTSSTPLGMGGVSVSGGVVSGSEDLGIGSSSSSTGSLDSMKLTSNYR